jgi:hypothetical protein
MQETENEISARLPSLSGDAASVPCDRPNCNQSEYLYMRAIKVEEVCETAEKLLEGSYQKHKQICTNKNS